jgi:hypothetical protein
MLATYQQQGEFLENVLNLLLYKNASNNIVEKKSDSLCIINNGIISVIFRNNKYVTQMDITIQLSTKILNFSVLYNEVEETFELYFSNGTDKKKRIRYNLGYETKSLYIQNRFSVFFSKK